MSISSEISRISGNIEAAYSAAEAMGAAMPQTLNSANLANAVGSIPQVDAYTKTETNALLSAKAPIISAETDPAYDTDLSQLAQQAVGDLTVVAEQGSLGHTRLLLSQGEYLFPPFVSATQTGEVNGVTIELLEDNSIRLNGTAADAFDLYLKSGTGSNYVMPLRKALEQGDTVTVGVLRKGSLTKSGGGNTWVRIIHRFYNANKSAFSQNDEYLNGEGLYTNSHQLSLDSPHAAIYIGISKNQIFDNYIITPFAFFGTDVTSVSDPAYTSGKLDISSTVAEYDYLSTYPNKHTVSYKADTKSYIDNKEIDETTVADIADQQIAAAMPTINSTISTNVNTAVNAKVTYITPEQFGAAGDGVTDDTQALQSALSRAGSSVCVKALKYYKTTSPVRIACDEGLIEINRIKYTGSDFAVKLATRNTVLRIKQIEASAGGGVLVKNDNTSGEVLANSFEFDYIYSDGDCIKFETVTQKYRIAYNNFKVPNLTSLSGNLIDINNSAVENYFFGGHISCENGWCVYKADSTGSNTFERFSFEQTSAICHGAAKFINCRTGEALNALGNKPEGTFIKLTDPACYITKELADENTCVTFTGVDVSEMASFAETIAAINDRIAEQDPDDPLKYYNACSDVITHDEYVIKNISRYRGSGEAETLDGRMVIYWNKKAYVPNQDVLEDITVTPFVPLSTIKNNPTYFRIGVADCVINLNDSYCPVGIDSFIVEQTSSYKASVYNKDNTLIFDGANLPAGKYKVSCYLTPVPATVFDAVNMPAVDRAYYAERIKYIYTGANEAWKVEPFVPTNVSSFTNDAGYLTAHQDISGKEDTSNKVTSLTSARTDTQYPSAKCVYNATKNTEKTTNKVTSLTSSSTNTQYPSAKCVYDAISAAASPPFIVSLTGDGLFDEEETLDASITGLAFITTCFTGVYSLSSLKRPFIFEVSYDGESDDHHYQQLRIDSVIRRGEYIYIYASFFDDGIVYKYESKASILENISFSMIGQYDLSSLEP